MLFWTRFGRVLGTVFGGFWTILGGFWGFEKEMSFEGEVGSRKSGSRDTKGELTLSWLTGLAALIFVNEQPSLASLIIDPWKNWAFGRNDHATHVPRGTVADYK